MHLHIIFVGEPLECILSSPFRENSVIYESTHCWFNIQVGLSLKTITAKPTMVNDTNIGITNIASVIQDYYI